MCASDNEGSIPLQEQPWGKKLTTEGMTGRKEKKDKQCSRILTAWFSVSSHELSRTGYIWPVSCP